MILDAHVHLITGTPGNEYLPPRLRWAFAMAWAYSGPPPWNRDPLDFYPRQEQRVTDPDGTATIAAMDKAGVDAAVLIHADFGYVLGQPAPKGMEEMHQDYANLEQRYPGRFHPFAGPDIRRPNSLQFVQQGIANGRFKGLKVFPHVGYSPADPLLSPFYDTCLEAGVPVAICTNFEPPYTPFTRGRFNNPMAITQVVADFPDLNVIIFHAGYPFDLWFEQCLNIAQYATNAYLEIDAWVMGFNSFPESISEEESIRRLHQARTMVGAHRIIFGSDGQFSPSSWGEQNAQRYARRVAFWKELPERSKRYGITFSREEVDLMLGLNLARLLKLVDMPEYAAKRRYGWKMPTPLPRPSP
ncbi:MAG: amidohydrolase family protein [Chloroflexi bacterium]|nr:amidohydrolase family protein [Chloroflexota bacterium]